MGYSMDTGASMTSMADTHTVHCLKMQVCVDSGYALVMDVAPDPAYTGSKYEIAADLTGACFDQVVSMLEPMSEDMSGPVLSCLPDIPHLYHTSRSPLSAL